MLQHEDDDPLGCCAWEDGMGGWDPLRAVQPSVFSAPPPPTAAAAAACGAFPLLSQLARYRQHLSSSSSVGVGGGVSSSSRLRARLSALEQDVGLANWSSANNNDSHTATRLNSAKMRRYALDQLERDTWVFWERQDRQSALRCTIQLANALTGTFTSSNRVTLAELDEWEFITRALSRFAMALVGHVKRLAPQQVQREARMAWAVKISHVRALVPRLYLQAACHELFVMKEDVLGSLCKQARGISHAVRRAMFLAYYYGEAGAKFTPPDVWEVLQLADKRDCCWPASLVLCSAVKHSNSDGGGGKVSFAEAMAKCGTLGGGSGAAKALLMSTGSSSVIKHLRLVLEVINKCLLLQSGGEEEDGVGLMAEFLDHLVVVEGEEDGWWSHQENWQACWRLVQMEKDSAVAACAKLLQLACQLSSSSPVVVDQLRPLMLDQLSQSLQLRPLVPHEQLAVERALRAVIQSDSHYSHNLLTSQAFYRILLDALPPTGGGDGKRGLCELVLGRFVDQIELLPLALECAKQCGGGGGGGGDHHAPLPASVERFLQRSITNLVSLSDEAKFDVLCDLRRSFSRSPRALKQLVLAMCWLLMERSSGGGSSQDFLCAGVGFCHATLPSVPCAVERGLLTCHVALVACAVGRLKQADALFKAAIQCLAVTPSPSLRWLELCRTVASTLVVAPGHPHAYYLVHGFANAVLQQHQHQQHLGEALLCVLDVVECVTRRQLPYHIARVDSNDVLYGDAELAHDAVQLASTVRARLTADGHLGLLPACSERLKRIQDNLQERRSRQ